MSYGIIKQISDREIEDTVITLPNNVVERLISCRQDEHHIEVEEFGDTTPLTCRFSKADPHILAVADEDGGLVILNTHHQGIKAVTQDWLAHKNAIFDVDWMPHDSKLLTASGDQTVILWDVQKEEKLNIYKGHTSSIKTARFGSENKWIFATGARDGNIMIFDIRVKQKDGFTPSVNIIRNAHKLQLSRSASKKKKTIQITAQSVTALVFQDDNALISTSSVDGTIRVWDLRKTYSVLKTEARPKHIFQYAGSSKRTHGYSNLVLDSSGTRLFANCMDNVIYQYDTAAFTAQPVARYRGHKNGTFYVKACLSPDEQFIVSGSSDNMAYIWRISEPTSAPWTLQGHSGEVSAVEWCTTDIGKMVTISDDATIRIWRLDDSEGTAQKTQQVIGRINRLQAVAGNDESSCDAGKKKPMPLTPKKGAVIPPSPVKPSQFLSHCIATLPAGKTFCDKENDSRSSIMQWFEKKPKWLPSPMKKTPKKLLITPKKQSVVTNSHQVAVSSGSENAEACLVKRKLYEQESPPEGSESKRRHLDDKYFSGHISDENSCDGIVDCSVRPQNNDSNTVTTLGKTEEICELTTPLKPLQSTAQFHSPTMNMPNYVLDPQPRTPIAKPDNQSTPKTPNWLMQIHKEKLTPCSKSGKNSDNVEVKVRRTPTSRTKQKSRDPKRSILKYFSPGGEKKKALN